MDIAEFLTPERIALDIRARNKSACLTEAARLLARSPATLDPAAVEAALLAREQLGSTGLGSGFALPHARVPGLEAYRGLFARLARPIDFAAVDDKPVDLVFVLLIPVDPAIPHVSALAVISRRFRDPDVAAKLRKAASPAAAFALLAGQGSALDPAKG